MRSLLVRLLLLCAVLVAALPCAQTQALVSLTSSLSTQQSPITPLFDSYTYDYEQRVASNADTLVIVPTLNDTAAAAGARIYASWNSGEEVQLTSMSSSPPFSLGVTNLNFLELRVQQSGIPDVQYTLSVIRATLVSHNSNLLSFSFRTAQGAEPSQPTALVNTVSPSTFSSKVFGYAAQLAVDVTSFRFVATVDAKATLRFTTTRTVLGPPAQTFAPTAVQGLASGALSPLISLVPGQQQRIDIRVIAEDGTTASNYAYAVGSNGDPLPAEPTVEQRPEDPNASSSSTGLAGTPGNGTDLGDAASTGPQAAGLLTALLMLAALLVARR